MRAASSISIAEFRGHYLIGTLFFPGHIIMYCVPRTLKQQKTPESQLTNYAV